MIFQFWKTKYLGQNKGLTNTSTDVPTLTEASPEAPLIYPSFREPVSRHVNYCVLFTTGPQYGFNNATLSNTPHFYVDNSNFVGPANFSFKRTTETYMRESRYFRNSASGITQLAGVYDTTIDLAVPIYSIYPSTFYRITLGAALKYVIPNTNLDLFTELGINGYYTIKTVTIDLSGPLGAIESKVTINGIWTDAESPFHLIRQDRADDDTSLEEEVQSRIQEYCLDIVDAVETSVQSLGRFGLKLPQVVPIDEIIENINEARDRPEDIADVVEEFQIASQAQITSDESLIQQLNQFQDIGAKRNTRTTIRTTGENGEFLPNASEYQVQVRDDGTLTVLDAENNQIGIYDQNSGFSETTEDTE